MTKRPSFREAIEWMAGNDDTEWVADFPEHGLSVTAALVADLFGKTDDQVVKSLTKELSQ